MANIDRAADTETGKCIPIKIPASPPALVENGFVMAKEKYILIIPAILFFVSFAAPAYATEEYAKATGSECRECHIDPSGGGELTETGKGYLLSVSPGGDNGNRNQHSFSRTFRLIAGYIHIATAFMWFGTILYVHLVLKPAYASKGLPRGEVKVGLVSMVIIAITGIILTYYKVPSFSFLVSSGFGVLLLAKIIIFIIMVLSSLFVVAVIGPKLKRKKKLQASMRGVLTQTELADFDGEDGRPAYFGYKGNIYDVSKSQLWKDGNHMKRHHAGSNLTGILAQAPHGEDKILAMPEVGRLSGEKGEESVEVYEKVFYAIAYMNLILVFIVLLILALWRWY